MTDTVSVVLIGIGGYGAFYLHPLLTLAQDHDVRLVATVDPAPPDSAQVAGLRQAGIPLYADLESFYTDSAADLAVIASPIHFHARQTLLALTHGSHVICEKPLCATVQDALQIVVAQGQAGRFVAVGYQWSFSQAIQLLKQDVRSGLLGRPLRLKCRVLWPRGAVYYARNQWAGRLRGDKGEWILDSPVNNATAHYLHNMFYILGESRETSAWPVSVEAELYRANPIENYDSAALRCLTAQGTEILFYASHAVAENRGPVFRYEFEHAVVDYATQLDGSRHGEPIIARFADGRLKSYGDPYAGDTDKLWQCADAVGTGRPVACDAAAATAHVLCVNGAQESTQPIVDFPAHLIRRNGDLPTVEGLADVLTTAYEQNRLPSELGQVAWARSGRWIDLTNYTAFPSRA